MNESKSGNRVANTPTLINLTAEVVSIGDEMTSGARLDTNAQWLSRRLGDLGVVVAFHTTVADTLEDNIDVFRIAAERADVVVITGGLGPTQDDLTREALAAVVDQPLVLSESAMQHIEMLFSRRKREMPERNRVQAMFPRGSQEIFNPQGTAPGIDLLVSRGDGAPSRVFALPGVPAEMKKMFDDSVAPLILEHSGGARCIRHRVMKLFGCGESDMEHQLGDMISRSRHPRVGITVSAATISLRITAMGDSIQQCDQVIAETRQEILERVGEFYFGDGESYEQYHAIDERLRQRGESLMIVELGDAAPLGDWFATLGDSPAFRGGLSLVGGDDLMRVAGGADVQQSRELIRQRFGADWLLLVDRYPSLRAADDSPMQAVDVELVVISPESKKFATKTRMGGHPEILQQRIGKAAMAWLRKILTK